MSEVSPLIVPFVVGVLLGAFSVGGLWLTVRMLAGSQRPLALLAASFGIRTGVVVVGLVLVMDGKWERIAVALLGYLLVRGVLIRTYGTYPVKQAAP